MKLPISEVIRVKSLVSNRIGELNMELHQVATVKVSEEERKEGTYEKHERSVEEVRVDLADAREDELVLGEILSRVNLENTVSWDGEEIPLTSALLKAKQLRGELNDVKRLSRYKKEEMSSGFGIRSGSDYTIAQFEPKEMKEEAKKLERQVNRLSSDINRANAIIEVDVPLAEKYM